MAHLDIDTADLVAAGNQAGAAASTLAGLVPEHLGPADAANAVGDALLADALTSFLDAWTPTHGALVATLESLGERLAGAAESFEGAEGAAAERLAHVLLPAGPQGAP